MDEQDIIYMAELEFGHSFVQNNYERILKYDYEDLWELYEEYINRKEN